MKIYKYKNENSFPVYLPCERGGQAAFQPGQATELPWFAKFCKKGQLTPVCIGKKRAPAKKSQGIEGIVIKNIDDLAAAVAKALGNQSSQEVIREVVVQGSRKDDSFDSTVSLEKLAAAQVTQQSDKKSNIEGDLGNVVETKKDKKDSQKMVDLLSGVDE